MEDELTAEYKAYLYFKDLGYNRKKSLLLLAIMMEMMMYDELESV